ncbi:hypothetical protein MMC29_000583 [Sticta canariensis]|nr:hypothetical protein [Sticta canariensis]
MSSMRNAVQRRNHRERAQPKERQKWGVLEKHTDYSLRAKDYNEKKKRLQILRQKAADRNPEEFHFEMISSKTHDRGQKFTDRGNAVLSQNTVKLLKTQDACFLKTMIQTTRKVRERLEQEVTIGGGEDVGLTSGEFGRVQSRHMCFVDTVEEQKQFNTKGVPGTKRAEFSPAFDPSRVEQDDLLEIGEEIDNGPSQLRKLRKTSSSHRDLKEDDSALRKDKFLRKLRKRGKEARTSRLNLLKLRERELLAAEQEIGLQRAKMNHSVRGMNKTGVKWKPRERKK